MFDRTVGLYPVDKGFTMLFSALNMMGLCCLRPHRAAGRLDRKSCYSTIALSLSTFWNNLATTCNAMIYIHTHHFWNTAGSAGTRPISLCWTNRNGGSYNLAPSHFRRGALVPGCDAGKSETCKSINFSQLARTNQDTGGRNGIR